MKKFVPGVFVLIAGVCVPVSAKPDRPMCGGPTPGPPAITDGSNGSLTTLEVWADALAQWVPCSDQEIATPGVISAHAFRFKPVKAARKNFDQGMRAVNKGLNVPALEHFREAIRLDPDYVQSHVQIGILLARAGQPMLALESFLRALALEPDADFLEFNIAIVLVTLHRPVEAESFARRVPMRSPSFAEAQYVVSLALAMQDNFSPEAIAVIRATAANRRPAREVMDWVESKIPGARVSGR